MKTENFHQAGCLLALTLAVSLAGLQAAVAEDADGVRVTDYFISHTSNEPFYAEQKLDPSVTLHVREVVLPGRERTVAQDGKVLLLIHGYSVPGYIAFDTDHGNCSLMRHFARAGWDTFALDLEGFGLSTRPPVMDDPTVFPDSKAPIHADVTLRDVERVVDFISALRGVEQVHLLGWSQGATVEAPLYAIRASGEGRQAGAVCPELRQLDDPGGTREVGCRWRGREGFHSVPSPERWAGLGTKAVGVAAPGWARWEGVIAAGLADVTETMLDTARVGAGMRVLDLACGAGSQTFQRRSESAPRGGWWPPIYRQPC